MVKACFRRFTCAQFGSRSPSKTLIERSKDVEVSTRVTVSELATKDENSFKLEVLVDLGPFEGWQVVKICDELLKTLVMVNSLHGTSCKSRRFVFSEYL